MVNDAVVVIFRGGQQEPRGVTRFFVMGRVDAVSRCFRCGPVC